MAEIADIRFVDTGGRLHRIGLTGPFGSTRRALCGYFGTVVGRSQFRVARRNGRLCRRCFSDAERVD